MKSNLLLGTARQGLKEIDSLTTSLKVWGIKYFQVYPGKLKISKKLSTEHDLVLILK